MKTKAHVAAKDFETLMAAGNTSPSGIWSNGDTMFVSDANHKKIFAYNMPASEGVTVRLPKPVVDTPAFDRDSEGDFTGLAAAENNVPWGIWSDWSTIWVADYEDGKIYAYDLKSKARAANHDFDTLRAAGNENPTGIWSDGETMWVLDPANNNTIYAYHTESKARDPSKDFRIGSFAGNLAMRDIWSDGQTMWVTAFRGTSRNSPSHIYAYDMETKRRVEDKEFGTLTAAGNHRPRGIWSDGVTMWVADANAVKIYAYDMKTKARVAAKEFETLGAVGNSPYGIWSNGATMFVSDANHDKIFAYNMPPATDTHVELPESDKEEITIVEDVTSN